MTEADGQAQDELDVDKLLEEVNKPAPERPMSGETEEAPAAAAEAKPPESPWWQQEFDHNGKKIKADSEDKARTWIQQGYNYSQRMGDFNRTKLQMEVDYAKKQAAIAEQEKKFSPYVKVNEWAVKNPDKWQQMLQGFEQAQTQVDPKLQSLEQRLAAFEQQQAEQKAEQEALRAAEEAKKYDDLYQQQLEATRKAFPTYDFDKVDEATGKTLILKTIEHAQKIGTGDFMVAFQNLHFPQLLESAKAAGLEAKAKEAQVNAKKGLLGTTQAPVKELKAVNPRTPWGDSSMKGENILKEMGF